VRRATIHLSGNQIRDYFPNSAKEVLMLSSTNFWMGFAGLIYLVTGVFILRKEISAARGWDKLITLGCVFIAVPLAVNEALNYVADTLLFAGAALVLASALPRDPGALCQTTRP